MNNQTAPEGEKLQEKIEKSKVEKSQGRKDWLKILEYAGLGSSAVGSIIAWWFKELLFAATPLTLTLGLNLLNREKLERLLRQENNATMVNIENTIEVLDSEIEEIATEQATIEPAISEDLSELEATIKDLENNAGNNEEIDLIFARIGLLEQKLDRVQDEVKSESEIEKETAEIRAIEDERSQLYASNAELTLDLKALRGQLDKLQKQVAKLQKQNREIVKPYLQGLKRAVTELQEK
ncbi:MAG: hypothetical protein SXA11_19935 [Cyanobacteriota bacterium]|nr:hypothetical protein [Cyanobacteriota bacterium]